MLERFVKKLLDLFVNGHLFENGIEFLQLESLRIVLLILYRDIAAGTGLTTCFVLGALHYYLYSAAFFSHDYLILLVYIILNNRFCIPDQYKH